MRCSHRQNERRPLLGRGNPTIVRVGVIRVWVDCCIIFMQLSCDCHIDCHTWHGCHDGSNVWVSADLDQQLHQLHVASVHRAQHARHVQGGYLVEDQGKSF